MVKIAYNTSAPKSKFYSIRDPNSAHMSTPILIDRDLYPQPPGIR